MQAHVDSYVRQFDEKLSKYIGCSKVDLEARFSRLRTEETNLGNLVADVVRTEFKADIGLVHAGCMRANSIYPAGPLMLKFVY